MLRFFDPVAEIYLRTHEEDMGRAEAAEYRVEEERAGRMAAEARAGYAEVRAEEELAGRMAAAARVAELEEELRRLRSE